MKALGRRSQQLGGVKSTEAKLGLPWVAWDTKYRPAVGATGAVMQPYSTSLTLARIHVDIIKHSANARIAKRIQKCTLYTCSVYSGVALHLLHMTKVSETDFE